MVNMKLRTDFSLTDKVSCLNLCITDEEDREITKPECHLHLSFLLYTFSINLSVFNCLVANMDILKCILPIKTVTFLFNGH